MTDINKLIQKYYNADGENITGTPKKDKAECYTNSYNKQQRLEANRQNRHLILAFQAEPLQTFRYVLQGVLLEARPVGVFDP